MPPCHACHIDFLREPMDELVPYVERKRLQNAATELAASPRVGAPTNRDEDRSLSLTLTLWKEWIEKDV